MYSFYERTGGLGPRGGAYIKYRYGTITDLGVAVLTLYLLCNYP